MKIGILGSGIVGQVLASAFQKEGYQVTLGTRNIAKEEVIAFSKKNPGIVIATFEDTAKRSELLVLAVKGTAVEEVIQLSGPDNLAGKVIIDTTNPIAAAPPVNGVLNYFTDINFSLMEKIQQILPKAKVVKAFNSVGNAAMYKPSYTSGKPSMFICGNEEEAKKTVTGILTAFGWDTEDMGKAEAARAIEPLCMLWCIPGILHHQWNHAFKLLRA